MRHKRSRFPFVLLLILVLLAVFLWRWHTGPGSKPEPLPAAAVQRVGPEGIYPDAARTPGFANPVITQDNIVDTICNPDWSTKEIRPPSSYTSRLKREQMQEWSLPGRTSDYEEDHLISLELGGNPTDPRNLWPEPYRPKPGAKEKDVVENYLHRQVCSGAMTLQAAQNAIATDWYKVYLEIRQ